VTRISRHNVTIAGTVHGRRTMRITRRSKYIRNYWEDRWSSVPADQPMENSHVYPLRYALMTIRSKHGKILEAGCGAGRILRYYKDRGYDIVGMDFIEEVVQKLRITDPQLKVHVGNITHLGYRDETFRFVLAFGLYHNLEIPRLCIAVRETYRVLEPKGRVCASFRADNVQTRINDWLEKYRGRKNTQKRGPWQFHKMNLTKSELISFFRDAGLKIERSFCVENMPLLYKFKIFRSKTHKDFNENLARKDGYRMSFLGRLVQKTLFGLFPDQLCNIYVVIAQRPSE
jgi:SAM-dependent methyltransferase